MGTCRDRRFPPRWTSPAPANPAVVATLRPDGSPHTAATWYLWDGANVLLNMDDSRLRLGFMRGDPRVALTALGDGELVPAREPARPRRLARGRRRPVRHRRLARHYTGEASRGAARAGQRPGRGRDVARVEGSGPWPPASSQRFVHAQLMHGSVSCATLRACPPCSWSTTSRSCATSSCRYLARDGLRDARGRRRRGGAAAARAGAAVARRARRDAARASTGSSSAAGSGRARTCRS